MRSRQFTPSLVVPSFVVAIALLAGCGGSSSSTEVTTEATAATVAASAATEQPVTTDATGEATQAPAAPTAAKALPSSADLCAMASPADLEATFGVAFGAGEPSEIAPDFPGCTWKTATPISGTTGLVSIRLCCPSMSAAQIATSLELTGGTSIGDQMNGLVRGPDDDIKLAQLKAYRNDIFIDADVDGIGTPNDIGMPIPGQKQLDDLKAFTELVAAKL